MAINKVIKRNGEEELFDPDKMNKWSVWGCANYVGVSWSDIVSRAIKSGFDGMTTSDLQKTLIDACIDLSKTNTEYEKVARDLLVSDLRKRVFGGFTPPSLKEFYHDMVNRGLWEDMEYCDEDLFALGLVIDHERDYNFPLSGVKQMQDKYLMKNKITGELYETPQFLYMGLAMASLNGSPLIDIVDFYHALSTHKCNIPTPPLIGCRTSGKGFASCCLISGGDSADSIEAAGHIVYQMVKNRSGIGIELETRGPREPVKKGLVQHNGKLNYYRMIDALTKANTQEARGGSATMQFPFFDPEIETLIQLRNPLTPDESRIDQMDYSLALNKYFYKVLTKKGKIALISPHYAPKTHEAFYGKSIKEFERVYNEEVNEWKDKKVIRMQDGSFTSPVRWVNAFDIAELFAMNRSDTARIYCHNVDETNRRSTYKCPVRQSNLCLEIVEPTAPYNHVTDLYSNDGFNPINGEPVNGESALCNLGGIVNNRIDTDEEYERIAYLLLKFVDNIIEMQTYPFPHMEYTSKARRNAGIGLINLAHGLAERGLGYDSDEGRTYMHEQSERLSYFLHLASIKLAEERGRCAWFGKTTYADGVIPLDNYCKAVDKYHNAKSLYDWDVVREGIKRHGIRNSVLEAYMPSESSSVTIGCTNGVEPIREGVIYKSSRQGDNMQIAPDWEVLQFDYQLAYDIPSDEYLKSMAVLGKHVGQAISTNVYYDLNKFPNREVPLSVVLRDIMLYAKLGGKTMYYHNTAVHTTENCENCSI